MCIGRKKTGDELICGICERMGDGISIVKIFQKLLKVVAYIGKI